MRGAMLVLDVSAEKVKAFQFANAGKGLQLTGFNESGIQNCAPDGEFLRGLAGKSFPGGVYILFPSEEAVIKNLSFPLRDEEKISRVLRFEAEKFLPYPVQDAVLDFIVVGRKKTGSDVLAAAAKKTTIEFYLGLFRGAGIVPRALVPDLVYLPELVEGSAPFMLVAPGEKVLKISIYKNGVPRIIRTIRTAADIPAGAGLLQTIEDEAGALFGAFSLTEPDCALEDVYIIRGNLSFEELKSALSKKLGLKVSALDASEGLKHNLDGEALSLARERLEPAAGLARAAASGRKLLNLKERKEKKSRKESPVLAAVLGAMILFFIFSSVFIRLKEREARLRAVRQEISGMVEQAFSAPELAGRSGVEIISILRERTRIRGGTADALAEIGSGRVLDGLRELVLSLPEGEGVNITGVRIDRGACYLDGRAGSFRQVEEVFRGVLASGYFEDARIGRAQVDSERGGVVFRIEIFLPGRI